MKKKTSRRLLEQSCGWIREHWNAQNLDVPDELLHRWIYNADDEENDPPGFYLAVFSFGFFQHDLVASNAPHGVIRKISASLLLERFQAWQIKLALAELHRVTELRLNPLPLFAFPENEQIEVWMTPNTRGAAQSNL